MGHLDFIRHVKPRHRRRLLFSVRRPQRRLDCAHHVVGQKRHAEAEQGRTGITQLLDLTVERLLHLLKRRLNRPSSQVNFCNLLGVGRLRRQVRHEVDLRVAIACRLVQHHRHPAQQEFLTGGVGDPQPLLKDGTGRHTSLGFPLPHQGVIQGRAMLTDHETALAAGDPEEEVGGAKVAVRNPEILGGHRLQDLVQKRPFLGMTVFTENHVDDQHQFGIEGDQGMARQGPGTHRP